MNRFEEALKYFDFAIEKNSEISTYYYNKGIKEKKINLAITLNEMKRNVEALKYFDLAI